MENEPIKDKSNGKSSQSPKDKIRALERHPEVLGCIGQVRDLIGVAVVSGPEYQKLDVTGFVSKCPEFIDVRTLPRSQNNSR